VEATVLYPPVDIKEFKFISISNYYLSFARLSDAKRVDKIVEAFKLLPKKKLIIIY
jgi:glycosyltransferase involved in cell wall biosynthesis